MDCLSRKFKCLGVNNGVNDDSLASSEVTFIPPPRRHNRDRERLYDHKNYHDHYDRIIPNGDISGNPREYGHDHHYQHNRVRRHGDESLYDGGDDEDPPPHFHHPRQPRYPEHSHHQHDYHSRHPQAFDFDFEFNPDSHRRNHFKRIPSREGFFPVDEKVNPPDDHFHTTDISPPSDPFIPPPPIPNHNYPRNPRGGLNPAKPFRRGGGQTTRDPFSDERAHPSAKNRPNERRARNTPKDIPTIITSAPSSDISRSDSAEALVAGRGGGEKFSSSGKKSNSGKGSIRGGGGKPPRSPPPPPPEDPFDDGDDDRDMSRSLRLPQPTETDMSLSRRGSHAPRYNPKEDRDDFLKPPGPDNIKMGHPLWSPGWEVSSIHTFDPDAEKEPSLFDVGDEEGGEGPGIDGVEWVREGKEADVLFNHPAGGGTSEKGYFDHKPPRNARHTTRRYEGWTASPGLSPEPSPSPSRSPRPGAYKTYRDYSISPSPARLRRPGSPDDFVPPPRHQKQPQPRRYRRQGLDLDRDIPEEYDEYDDSVDLDGVDAIDYGTIGDHVSHTHPHHRPPHHNKKKHYHHHRRKRTPPPKASAPAPPTTTSLIRAPATASEVAGCALGATALAGICCAGVKKVVREAIKREVERRVEEKLREERFERRRRRRERRKEAEGRKARERDRAERGEWAYWTGGLRGGGVGTVGESSAAGGAVGGGNRWWRSLSKRGKGKGEVVEEREGVPLKPVAPRPPRPHPPHARGEKGKGKEREVDGAAPRRRIVDERRLLSDRGDLEDSYDFRTGTLPSEFASVR